MANLTVIDDLIRDQWNHSECVGLASSNFIVQVEQSYGKIGCTVAQAVYETIWGNPTCPRKVRAPPAQPYMCTATLKQPAFFRVHCVHADPF